MNSLQKTNYLVTWKHVLLFRWAGYVLDWSKVVFVSIGTTGTTFSWNFCGQSDLMSSLPSPLLSSLPFRSFPFLPLRYLPLFSFPFSSLPVLFRPFPSFPSILFSSLPFPSRPVPSPLFPSFSSSSLLFLPTPFIKVSNNSSVCTLILYLVCQWLTRYSLLNTFL